MDALKIFLNSAAGQHIQRVYLNNKMEWLFAPRPGYEKELSREQVLAYPPTTQHASVGAAKQVLNEADLKKPTSSNNPSAPKHGNRF